MTHYVLGFAFDEAREHVVLLRKKRGPAENLGLLNGLGGKIEAGETTYEAMTREFHEEAGVQIRDWKYQGAFKGEGFSVRVFAAFTDQAYQARQMEDEEVILVPLRRLKDTCRHVPRLIGLCLDDSIKNFMWEE